MQDEQCEWMVITDEEEGDRIDKILANRYKDIQSRTYFQKLIADGNVLLNDSPVKKRAQPKSGDLLQVQFVLAPEMNLIPEEIPLEIIYEDDDLLAVNKPPGMVVHPAPGNWTGTFANALLYHCSRQSTQELRPGIVHRLDKDTSGVLLAAKTNLAHQRLIEAFSNRTIEKEYQAICVGNPGDRTINAPIARHPYKRKQMAVVDGGRHSVTHTKVLGKNQGLTYVDIGLETGRTHQIRVHLQHVGTPILGDSVYGSTKINKQYHVNRQMLHANVLRFTHPLTGKMMELSAPLPKDMDNILKKLSFL